MYSIGDRVRVGNTGPNVIEGFIAAIFPGSFGSPDEFKITLDGGTNTIENEYNITPVPTSTLFYVGDKVKVNPIALGTCAGLSGTVISTVDHGRFQTCSIDFGLLIGINSVISDDLILLLQTRNPFVGFTPPVPQTFGLPEGVSFPPTRPSVKCVDLHEGHIVVENYAANKKFYYCRKCRVEVIK